MSTTLYVADSIFDWSTIQANQLKSSAALWIVSIGAVIAVVAFFRSKGGVAAAGGIMIGAILLQLAILNSDSVSKTVDDTLNDTKVGSGPVGSPAPLFDPQRGTVTLVLAA